MGESGFLAKHLGLSPSRTRVIILCIAHLSGPHFLVRSPQSGLSSLPKYKSKKAAQEGLLEVRQVCIIWSIRTRFSHLATDATSILQSFETGCVPLEYVRSVPQLFALERHNLLLSQDV